MRRLWKAWNESQKHEFGIGQDKEMAYIARCDCGCIVSAFVDTYENSGFIAEKVAEEIRDGRHIQRVPVKYVRGTPWMCEFHKNQEIKQKVMDRLKGRPWE